MLKHDRSKFESVLSENGLWSKKSLSKDNSLMRAVSNAMYFTDIHHSALSRHVLNYFVAHANIPSCTFYQSLSEMAQNLYKSPQCNPNFEDFTLQIVADILQTRIELYCFYPRGLSTKIYFKKTSKKIRLAKYSENCYVAIFKEPLEEHAIFAQGIILDLIDAFLNPLSEQRPASDSSFSEFINFECQNFTGKQISDVGDYDSNLCKELSQYMALKTVSKHNPITSKNFSLHGSSFSNLQIHFKDSRPTPDNRLYNNPSISFEKHVLDTFMDEFLIHSSDIFAIDICRYTNLNESKLKKQDRFDILHHELLAIPLDKEIQKSNFPAPNSLGVECISNKIQQTKILPIFHIFDDEQTPIKTSKISNFKIPQTDIGKRTDLLEAEVSVAHRQIKLSKFYDTAFLKDLNSISEKAPNVCISSISENRYQRQSPSPHHQPMIGQRVKHFEDLGMRCISNSSIIIPQIPNISPEDLPIISLSHKDDMPNDRIAHGSKKTQFEVVEPEVRTGVLKFFDEKNGFGFITVKTDSDPFDVFVYKRDLVKAQVKMATIRSVKRGAIVTFNFKICRYIGKLAISKKAQNIELINEIFVPNNNRESIL